MCAMSVMICILLRFKSTVPVDSINFLLGKEKKKKKKKKQTKKKKKNGKEQNITLSVYYPVSILYKSIAGRFRPVRVADGPITARYRFIKNATWVICKIHKVFALFNS